MNKIVRYLLEAGPALNTEVLKSAFEKCAPTEYKGYQRSISVDDLKIGTQAVIATYINLEYPSICFHVYAWCPPGSLVVTDIEFGYDIVANPNAKPVDKSLAADKWLVSDCTQATMEAVADIIFNGVMEYLAAPQPYDPFDL